MTKSARTLSLTRAWHIHTAKSPEAPVSDHGPEIRLGTTKTTTTIAEGEILLPDLPFLTLTPVLETTVEDHVTRAIRAPKSEARWFTLHRPALDQVPLLDLSSRTLTSTTTRSRMPLSYQEIRCSFYILRGVGSACCRLGQLDTSLF